MKKRIILGAVAIGAALTAFAAPAAQAGTAQGPYRSMDECNAFRNLNWGGQPTGPCYLGRDGMYYFTLG